MGRPSRKARAVMAQTAFVGVRVRRFTAAHTLYRGTPPSRENDHSILQERSHACASQSVSKSVSQSHDIAAGQLGTDLKAAAAHVLVDQSVSHMTLLLAKLRLI